MITTMAPTGYTSSDTGQDAIGFLGHLGTLLYNWFSPGFKEKKKKKITSPYKENVLGIKLGHFEIILFPQTSNSTVWSTETQLLFRSRTLIALWNGYSRKFSLNLKEVKPRISQEVIEKGTINQQSLKTSKKILR